jgi:ABC-type multidrug transport system fused ATPase/permease subunit
MKLDDLIPRLNRNVGEIGVKLSGGQKQRVAIARVLLKNPDMLVVDEATSAVDPSTERLVHDALDAVSPGATRIFVAHRISTVQDSDLIVVMDKGNIVATGKHEELLETCPLYQDLVSNLLLRT